MGNVFRFDELDSTNTKALALAREGLEEAVVTAKSQTGGRGRLGRSFLSPEGGLYLSVLTSRLAPGDRILALTPAAALAVRRSIARTYGLACQIKYPNDLILEDRKICGILCESLTEGDRFSAVIGIGVNVCSDVPAPSDAPDYPPGSLKDFCGKAKDPASLQELESVLIEELTSLIDAFAAGQRLDEAEYRRHCINCPDIIVPY